MTHQKTGTCMHGRPLWTGPCDECEAELIRDLEAAGIPVPAKGEALRVQLPLNFSECAA